VRIGKALQSATRDGGHYGAPSGNFLPMAVGTEGSDTVVGFS
jgi:hypothetical protein